MSAIERRYQINPHKSFYGKLTKTQVEVLNDALDAVENLKKDPTYNDEQHLILEEAGGAISYFDSYKYVYSIKSNEFGYAHAVNNNIGPGEIVSARLWSGGEPGWPYFVIDHYVGDNKMIQFIYELPDNMKNNPSNIGQFLLTASSLHPYVIGKLNKISEFHVISDGKNIKFMNEQGEVIIERPIKNSFFNDSNSVTFDYIKNRLKNVR